MWKFDHAAPAGSRVTPIGAPDAGSLGSADYSTHVFDPKRNRSIMFGGNMNGAYYSYVAKPNSTVRQTAAFSGNTSMLGGPSPGVIYDPVRDVYVLWRGGRSLTVINPDTFVCTVYTPTAGATPTIPRQASQSNAGVWHRFAYLPAYDVYATVSHAADVGAFVYMPKSTALVYDP